MSERIDALGTRLDDRIDALEARLDGRIDSLEATLRAEIVDSRCHGDILYESLRNDIRILAEAVAGISTRLDARGIWLVDAGQRLFGTNAFLSSSASKPGPASPSVA